MALTLKEQIAREAEDLGFAAVRFASADPPKGAGDALDDFLAKGRHGDMAWLAANSERRKLPRAIWPDVKTIIMLGLSTDRSVIRLRFSGCARVVPSPSTHKAR